MPCYHPIQGWLSREKTDKGLRKVVFKTSEAYDSGHQVIIPCGRCIGCRLERSRQWALRCVHESLLWDENCFITLTYDNEHLVDDSLHKEDFQKFMRRLRKYYVGKNIRYYHCGEYGDDNGRPHYHACLFNHDFGEDKSFWKSVGGFKLYVSETLNKIWGKGYCVIGEVTFESAAYVARYINKKLLGKDKEKINEHYKGRLPEYSTMSRRPGIGAGFYKNFREDIYRYDYVVKDGVKMAAPKYYDNLLKKDDSGRFEKIKKERKYKIKETVPLYKRLMGFESKVEDMSLDRLEVKEQCTEARVKSMVRDI